MDAISMNRRISRRSALQIGLGLAGAAALGGAAWAEGEKLAKYKQASAMGPFRKMTIEEACVEAKKIGLVGFDLCGPENWPTLKKHGLICTMAKTHSLKEGLCDPANHESCLEAVRATIDAVAAEGWPNVITFSGNRNGMDDELGLENSVAALKKIAPYAEQKKVTICLEFLNSQSHKDYMGDSTRWCSELVRRVGSERVKVLYDIFHAGMMGENIIEDIRKHYECWGHYHTAGVPGRHELDDTQTLDYPAIMKAIAETGFSGIVAHEFSPTRDPMESLSQAFKICDV